MWIADIAALFAFWDSLGGIEAMVMIGLVAGLGYHLVGKGNVGRRAVTTPRDSDPFDSPAWLYDASAAASNHHHHADAGAAGCDTHSSSDFDSGCDSDPN